MLKGFIKGRGGAKPEPASPKAEKTPTLPPRATSMTAWTVPPFSHSTPERHVGILVTQHGLLVFPKSSTYHKGAASSPPASVLSTHGSGDGFRVASLGNRRDSSAASSSLDAGFLIKWNKDADLVPLTPTSWRSMLEQYPEDQQLECSGIIGISKLFSSSYLFIITSSKLIGTYFHASRPIYCCTGVVAIPLLRPEATQAVQALLSKISRPEPANTVAPANDSDDSSDDDSDTDDVQTPAAISREPFFADSAPGSRFETLKMPKSRPWLTKAARAVSDGRIQTATDDPSDAQQEEAAVDSVELPKPEAHVEAVAEAQWQTAKQAELEEKVVRETAKHFARGEFWFTYDFDLTTSLQRKNDSLNKIGHNAKDAASPTTSIVSTSSAKQSSSKQPEFPVLQEPYGNLPLWRRADRRFWHNEHMCKDLIKAGLHAFILPVMQGYIQTVALPINPLVSCVSAQDANPSGVARCQMMVISRRSKERAGLRYQRRGINESGQVANYVETEQLVYVLRDSTATGVSGDVLSFLQFRGSIPLFWSQSPFTLKPPPVLERGPEENLAACTKHFAAQVERYGVVTCINLAEQGGKEGAISEAYRSTVGKLADDSANASWAPQVKYVDFDFHKECSGMRFENVGKLIDQMQDTLAQMQYFHQKVNFKAQTEVLMQQKGAFRVSCLDCLDRTNVVQSAFARHVLARQLGTLGIQVTSTNPAS